MSTTATPARRKKKGTHADTPEVKRESMPPDGNAGDHGAKDYETEDDEEVAILREICTPGEWLEFLNGQLRPQGVERELGDVDLSKEGEQDQDWWHGIVLAFVYLHFLIQLRQGYGLQDQG
jgi:hypothetical protein